MKKTLRKSLRPVLADELKALGKMSYQQIKDFAIKLGYKETTVNRRLQDEGAHTLPVIKLNAKGKPTKGSEKWESVKWVGTKTVWNK